MPKADVMLGTNELRILECDIRGCEPSKGWASVESCEVHLSVAQRDAVAGALRDLIVSREASSGAGGGSCGDVELARICHEVNRAYCGAIGDDSQVPWEQAPKWQQKAAIQGVVAHRSGTLGPRASHYSWMEAKRADGWTYGPEKNPEKKEHPCMVPYDKLPPEQRMKDVLFAAVVSAVDGRSQ